MHDEFIKKSIKSPKRHLDTDFTDLKCPKSTIYFLVNELKINVKIIKWSS